MTAAPYVGLAPFGEGDADRFFGRDAERKRIIANLQASRFTLLYARSGVGKSSLLRAGVVARLAAAPGSRLVRSSSAAGAVTPTSSCRSRSTPAEPVSNRRSNAGPARSTARSW